MTTRSWLHRLRGERPINSYADQQRMNALELIASTAESGTWPELSRHHSGFVREMAVRELSAHPSPEALVALVERLNDWVPQVREQAAAGMQSYLSSEHVSSLLVALNPLMALAARRRADHSVTLTSVRAVLQSPDVRDQVHRSFLTQQSKAACYLFALLLEAGQSPHALLRDGLAHRELNVRLAAVEACETLDSQAAHALLLDALPRSIARVRTRILRALLPALADPKPILQQALLNGSGAVRSLALWEAPRYGLEAKAVLAAQLRGPMPGSRPVWLGVLGLARDLAVELPQVWWQAAIATDYASVRLSAVYAPGERSASMLFGALDDASDKVFNALIVRLGKLPWATLDEPARGWLKLHWHQASPVRREQVLGLLAAWQQLLYLLERLDSEPFLQGDWLEQIARWCDRQYRIIDPYTPKAQQAALKQQLQQLAKLGWLEHRPVARVAG